MTSGVGVSITGKQTRISVSDLREIQDHRIEFYVYCLDCSNVVLLDNCQHSRRYPLKVDFQAICFGEVK